jgi:hypothetical protein
VVIKGDDQPSVSVFATGSLAGEANDPGIFTVSRTGNTASAITVA